MPTRTRPVPTRHPWAHPWAWVGALLLGLSTACAGPGRLARVPVGSVLLVASAGEGWLAAHNPQTGSRTRAWPVAEAPTALTVTRDGRRAVVAGRGVTELVVLDLVEEVRHARVDLPERPRDVVMLDRRSEALVALDDQVVRVGLHTGAEAGAVLADLGQPVALAWSPGLERGYLVDAASADLLVFDLAGRTLGRVSLPADARRALRRPAAEEIWIPGGAAGEVLVVDGRELTVERIAVPGAPVTLGMDGKGSTVLVADAAGGRLARVDAERRTVEAWIDLTPGAAGGDPTPGDVLVEPDGAYAFVALVHAGRIAVVDLSADEVTGSFPVDGAPVALAWTWLRRGEQGPNETLFD